MYCGLPLTKTNCLEPIWPHQSKLTWSSSRKRKSKMLYYLYDFKLNMLKNQTQVRTSTVYTGQITLSYKVFHLKKLLNKFLHNNLSICHIPS